MFDRDKIYAYLNLDDNELFIYQRLFDLLARDVPRRISSSISRRRPTCCSAALRERAEDPEADLLVPDGTYSAN